MKSGQTYAVRVERQSHRHGLERMRKAYWVLHNDVTIRFNPVGTEESTSPTPPVQEGKS